MRPRKEKGSGKENLKAKSDKNRSTRRQDSELETLLEETFRTEGP